MQVPEPYYFGVKVTAPAEGDPPFRASVNIRLNTYSQDPNGSVLIGASLAIASEVDYLIDSLIRELEEARTEAKRQLRRHN